MTQVSRTFVGKSSLDLDTYVSHPATLYFISSFNWCVQGSRRRHIIFIIIIIIRHGLGLYRPVSASPNSLLFNGLPSHLRPFVYSSTLFLASCCCSCLLHVVAILICIILVSLQLVLLSALPRSLHFFCSQIGRSKLFFWKISYRLMSNFF